MRSISRHALGAGAALTLLVVAPPVLRAQEISSASYPAPSLFETVTVDAVAATRPGGRIGLQQDTHCGSPFDVRIGNWHAFYGPRSGVWLGRPWGYRPIGRPYGWYGGYGGYGYGGYGYGGYGYGGYGYGGYGYGGYGYGGYGYGSYGWDRAGFGHYGALGASPCGYATRTGWSRPFLFYDGYGFYVASRWSHWAWDPWTWGYGYNPYLAYGSWNPRSGYWAPGGYGYAPYGVNRDYASPPRGARGQTKPRTIAASPDGGPDETRVTRVGTEGIRAGGADLRRVRPDLPPVVVFRGTVPETVDGSSIGAGVTPSSAARRLSRETLGDALARSRTELAARRLEPLRSSETSRTVEPLRKPEVYRPVEPVRVPDRARSTDRIRDWNPRSSPSSPDREVSRSRPGTSSRGFAPPRSFTSPPRAPAPSPRAAPSAGGRKSGKARASE